MPRPSSNHPPQDPIASFEASPYGYWVLSSLSVTEQDRLKAALKEDTQATQRHLELAQRSSTLASEKGFSESDWKGSGERLIALVNAAMSAAVPPESALNTPPEAGAGTTTSSTGGIAALPENQG